MPSAPAKKIEKVDQTEQSFALAYIEHGFNGLKALKAVKPKLTDKSAGVEASKLLANPKVQELLSTELERIRNRQEFGVQEVMEEWRRLAFSNMDDFSKTDDEGNTYIDLSMAQGNRALMAAVKSIETIEEPVFEDGEQVGTRRRIKVTLHSKDNALDKVSRIFGLYEGKEAPNYHLHQHNDNRTQVVVVNGADAAKDYRAFIGR